MAAGTDAVPARPAWYEGRYARWLVAADHKAIGVLYIWTALVFLVLATIAMLVERAHTAAPQTGYDEVATFHVAALTSLVLVPLFLGLALYIVPLQVGARGIVAPHVAALSYWLFALGGLTLVLTYFSAGPGSCGWSCTDPLTGTTGHTGDLWLISLAVLAGSTFLASFVLIVTVRRLSAIGMTSLNNAPFTRGTMVFAWLVLPFCVLEIVNAVLLVLARHGRVDYGVDAQRALSWAFGRPELALLVFPATAIVREIWRVGRPAAAVVLAVGATLTVVGGIGGALLLSGFNGRPFGWSSAVAIFDYLLLVSVLLALFAGLEYWWPKLFGRILDDGLGQVSAWFIAIGLNLALFPAYLASAKTDFTYPRFASWDTFARVSMVGVSVFAFGLLLFLVNALRRAPRAGNDPWRADTLEWLTTSPPPAHDFDTVPEVTSPRPLRDLRERLEARGEL